MIYKYKVKEGNLYSSLFRFSVNLILRSGGCYIIYIIQNRMFDIKPMFTNEHQQKCILNNSTLYLWEYCVGIVVCAQERRYSHYDIKFIYSRKSFTIPIAIYLSTTDGV